MLYFGKAGTGDPQALNGFFYFLLLPLLSPTHSGIFYSFYFAYSPDGDKNIIPWAKTVRNQGTRESG